MFGPIEKNLIAKTIFVSHFFLRASNFLQPNNKSKKCDYLIRALLGPWKMGARCYFHHFSDFYTENGDKSEK